MAHEHVLARRLTRTTGRLISASLLPLRICTARDAHGQPIPHGSGRAREFWRDGNFGQLMADSRKKRKSHGPRTGRPAAAKPAPTTERVRDLAWAGQHAQAIELATAALATTTSSVAGRLDLLDLRPE